MHMQDTYTKQGLTPENIAQQWPETPQGTFKEDICTK